MILADEATQSAMAHVKPVTGFELDPLFVIVGALIMFAIYLLWRGL
jgi:hypothetical protein